jgi:hypothetical protein
VKKALLSLALALVAANSAFAATAVAGGSTLPENDFGPFNIAEAYPVDPLNYDGDIPCPEGDETTISPNNRWIGGLPDGPTNSRAVGGVLSFQTDGNVLDKAAFATCDPEETDPFVQSYRLIKEVPGSQKCPTTYEKQKFFQFGSNVRTWWTLIYTMPDTTFTLELTVRCLDSFGRPTLHIDRYIWRVVATLDSLRNVIDVLHTGALGTTEIPCIASEDMYEALQDSVTAIEDNLDSQADAQDALFNAEACVISFACFTDCFIPNDVFSAAFPPANSLQFGDYGFTGLIDTLENPCACKILVDLEFIGECYEITSN